MREATKTMMLLRKDTLGRIIPSLCDAPNLAAGDAQFLDDPVMPGTCALRPALHAELTGPRDDYPPGVMVLICRDFDESEYRAIVKLPPNRRKNIPSNILLAIRQVKKFNRSLGDLFAQINSNSVNSK